DQSGRQNEASLRGLDALLGRPASKARATQAADPSANRALAAQLERGVSAALNSRDGVVTLRLSPEQLGPLKVRVSVDKGAVKAAFEASSPQAKQAVEQSIPTLKEALAAKGLTIERIEVTLAQPLPQRELGLSAQPSFEQPPAGLGNASVGDQTSSDRGRDGSSGDRPSSEHSSSGPDQIAFDLSPIEQTGFRYITTPDGRLGVVALA
ncbi:MAG: flagellar hook-length control protein FliK, partial [Phycisphaerales bacterium]|nr:flagellar hook-length control protein FliK [Phycisphaerales bacterium]